MKFKTFLLFIILLLSTLPSSYAGSAGDEGVPPSGGGGGGGGGGGPQFFDYYVPLVFNASHPQGESQVVIWTYTDSSIQTSFALDRAGSSAVNLGGISNMIFTPSANKGLTNGSLIRSTSPLLVVGQRYTEDLYRDRSFGYSILSDRMMGFEFTAPIDGFINIMSSQQATTIRIKEPSQETEVQRTLNIPFRPVEIQVEAGTYINSTGPISGAFISYSNGTQASMAVPRYLKGDNYLISGDAYTLNENEIDKSYLSIIPERPTELTFIYSDGSTSVVPIFSPQKFSITPGLRGINSSRAYLDISLHKVIEYGGIQRRSMVQLFAGNEMRAGELFIAPSGYSSDFIYPQSDTSTNIITYNATHPYVPGYLLNARDTLNTTQYDTYQIANGNKNKIVVANDSIFGIVTSPGQINHPMDASLSFANIPLNSQSSKNITGLESTWYRFPNVVAGNITVIPGPIEEYTGQVIVVKLLSNGSLPASSFKMVITIDDEEPIEIEFDFVAAGTNKTFTFERFMEYGKEKINVTVTVDVDNEVSEINEDDNYMEGNFNVIKNIRLRGSFVLLIMLVFSYGIVKLRRWLIDQRKVNRAHVDVLITEEVTE